MWRVGGKVTINVYDGDTPVCQCQTPEYAALIVAAVNEKWGYGPLNAQVAELRSLKSGWNSYHAKPVDERAIQAALKFLRSDMALRPTSPGGVQIDGAGDVQIEFGPDGTQVLD